MKHELISQQITEVEQQAISDTRKRDAKIKLYKYQTAWGRKHRRISLSGVPDPTGKAVADPECVAAELASYWGKLHSRVDCSEEDRQLHRSRAPPLAPTAFRTVVIPRGGPAVVDTLYGLYSEMLANGNAPVGFNHGMAAFLAKGSDPEDTPQQIIRKPEVTRPITLGNYDNKLVSVALNRSFSRVAAQTVLGNQRGFLAGRFMNENIINLESKAVSWFAQCGHQNAGTIYYNVRAAFPSRLRSFVLWVLRAMGVLSFVTNVVHALYTDVQINILSNGIRRASFVAPRGIRQGCPLSGTIFCLALDP
eukprot:9051087-Pyramimonas_sp.AAC.1